MRQLFQASPNGDTSGLYLSTGDAGSVAILVYPKLWAAQPSRFKVRWSESDPSLSVALAELDFLEVDASPERLALLAKATRVTGDPGSSPLLAPASRALDDRVASPDSFIEPITAAVALDQLMRRLGVGSLVSDFDAVNGPNFESTLFRPLLLRAFLDEVEPLVRNARRGYLWRTEPLTTVRGRVDPASMVVNEATGWPSLVCTYEDFARDTPLLMAICTALTAVAQEAKSTWPGGTELQERAIFLRRLLGEVPDSPSILAFRMCITPPRSLDARQWGQALQLGAGVLQPSAGVHFDAVDSASEIRVPTWRLWELLLLETFRAAGLKAVDGNSQTPLTVLNIALPWEGLTSKRPRPDIALCRESGWAIVDAKYKKAITTPAADDLYQMFAYSHLANDAVGSAIDSLSLVYPACSSDLRPSVGPFPRNMDGDASLSVHWLEFPSPGDVESGWSAYIARNAERAHNLLGTASARAGA